MSHKPQIVFGDDCDLSFTVLDDDGDVLDFAGASSVKLAIVSIDRTQRLAGPYTCDSAYGSSNWTLGIGQVALVGAETDTIRAPWVAVEIQIVLAGKKITCVNSLPIAGIRGLIA